MRFKPLKAKIVCFIHGVNAYRAVNIQHLGYKKKPDC